MRSLAAALTGAVFAWGATALAGEPAPALGRFYSARA